MIGLPEPVEELIQTGALGGLQVSGYPLGLGTRGPASQPTAYGVGGNGPLGCPPRDNKGGRYLGPLLHYYHPALPARP